MDIEEFRECCLAVKGAEECFPFGDDVLVYKVMGKMFTYAPLEPKSGRFFANMKCAPEKSEALMEHYADICFGYHSDKKYWITVYLDGDVPDRLIRELVANSVREVLHKLPRSRQAEYEAEYGDIGEEVLVWN